jgi:hypothetical protein
MMLGPDPLEFFGDIGLAPSWINHPLDKAGRGWVTACLLVRTNDSNVTNSLSLRGPHKALDTDAAELLSHPLEEGAFYGNYFESDGELFACRGEDPFISLRLCTDQIPGDPTHTMCGFVYAGDCGDFALTTPACEKSPSDSKGYYQKCHDGPIVPHRKSKKFQEVITSFLDG